MEIDLTNPIFHDEAKATAHMEAERWPDGVTCPLCGSSMFRRMEGKTQASMFLCTGCREKFTVRTKTIFERSGCWPCLVITPWHGTKRSPLRCSQTSRSSASQPNRR
jgi:transposase-like protein